MAADLAGYFSSQGQALPSLTARAGLYSQNGGQGNYMGTAQQNQYLLGKLQGGTSPTGTSVSFNAAPTTLSGYVAANSGGVTSAQQALQAAETGYDPTSVYNAAAAANGLPAAQQTAQQALQQLVAQQNNLNALPGQVADRLKTLGTQVTDAQRARWLNSESTPLSTLISSLSNAKSVADAGLNTAQANTNNAVSLSGQANNAKIKALTDALTNAQSNFSTGEDALKTDLANKLAATKAAKSGSGSGTASVKTISNKLNSAFGSINSAQNFIPSADPKGRAGKYISNNEYSQAIDQVANGYGVDANTAQSLVDKALAANGWQNWDSLDPAQQKKILASQ